MITILNYVPIFIYLCVEISLMVDIKRIGSIFFLCVYLLGTTGISIYHRICNASHQDEVAVYPGVFYDREYESCCDSSTDCSCTQIPENPEWPVNAPSFANDCCKTTSVVVRLEVQSLRTEKLLISRIEQISLADCSSVLQYPQFVTPSSERRTYTNWHDPPAIHGKQLVLFLQQRKIPAPLT